MPLSTRITNGTVGNNVSPQSTKPSKSPDQKGKVKSNKNDNDEEEQENTLKDFVIFHLDKFFVEHIPVDSVKELSSRYMYYFGVVAYAVMFLYFIYFTYSSYIGAISQAFIALDDTSGDCNTVQIAVTGNYLADREGNWIGSPAFAYADAKYSVNLNNFEGTPAQYASMMLFYQNVLSTLGRDGSKDSLPYNLARWTSFIRYYAVQNPSLTNFSTIGYGQLQYIQLSGDPQTMFNLNFQQMVMGSGKGYCPVTSFTEYDLANGRIYTNLNHSYFISEPLCAASVIPNSFGYSQSLDDDVFQVALEVRAFMTAFAVNIGVLDITSLYRSGSKTYNFEFANVSYVAGEYFDIRYSEMNPIFCLYNTSYAPPKALQYLCVYLESSTIGLPVFNHLGTSLSEPSYCSCSNSLGNTAKCQVFNLMSSLVYFPVALDITDPQKTLFQQLNYILRLLSMYTDYRDFNYASYNATWGAATIAYGRKSPNTTTSSYVKNSFNFCNIKITTCSIAVFHSTDQSSQLISQYKYQLTNGSCSDSFTIPNSDYQKLVQSPPVQLTENYYECYSDSFTAFINALGIASGNTQLAVPLTVIFLLPLVYFLLIAMNQAPPKEEYNNREKTQALEILSILLLRLRDGKSRGIRKNGILMQLTNELIKAAKEESGYPDSDDDADEDEEDDNEEEDSDNEEDEEENKMKQKSKSIHRKEESKAAKASINLDSDDEEEYESSPSMIERPSTTSPKKKRESRKSKRKSTKKRQSSFVGGSGPAEKGSTPVRTGGGRTKMGVFTKQLEEPEPPKRNRGRAVTGGGEDELRDSMNHRRGSAKLFSYLFSSSSSSTNKKTDEPINTNPSITGDHELMNIGNPMLLSKSGFDLIDLNNPPQDVQIMNYALNYPTRKISGEQINILVDDLMSSFSQAINLRPNDPALMTKSTMSTAIDSEPYKQGCALSYQLAQINFQEFVSNDDPTIFFKLSNALSMHASIELRCEMKQLEMLYADRVGYNVGGRLMTAAGLMKLL